MNYKEFSLLNKMVKATKSDNIVITPTQIIGSDKELTTVTTINSATLVDKIYEFNKEGWSQMVKETKDHKDLEFNSIFDKYFCIKRIGSVPTIDVYYNCQNYLSCSTDNIISIVDIKADKEFMNIISKKAADGASRYIIDKDHILSIFSGLLPINKNDSASLNIYDHNKYPLFIAEFIINKGYCKVHKYIQYLK